MSEDLELEKEMVSLACAILRCPDDCERGELVAAIPSKYHHLMLAYIFGSLTIFHGRLARDRGLDAAAFADLMEAETLRVLHDPDLVADLMEAGGH